MARTGTTIIGRNTNAPSAIVTVVKMEIPTTFQTMRNTTVHRGIGLRVTDTGFDRPLNPTRRENPKRRQRPLTISAIRSPASVGFWPTFTPAAARASILPFAVSLPPEVMAPAWPIFLPSGAVTPAM